MVGFQCTWVYYILGIIVETVIQQVFPHVQSKWGKKGDQFFYSGWGWKILWELGAFQGFAHQMPPHGYEKWRLVQFFYQGLSQPNCSMIESMNGWAFLNLTGDLAYKALDKLANNSQQWDFTSSRDKSARNSKRGGILELKGESKLTQKMDAIVKRLDVWV